MKKLFEKLIAILIVCATFFLTTVSCAESEMFSGKIINCDEAVNVRSGPGLMFSVIGSIRVGTSVTVTNAFCEKEWHEIQFNNQKAYVSKEYVRFEKPEGNIATFSEKAKYIYLFQSDVTAYTTDNKPEEYQTKKQAESHLAKVTVPVWEINSKGKKHESTKSIYVNSLLKDEVFQVFNEIFDLPEKFPVKTLVGFRWNKNGEVSGPLLDNVTCMSAHAYGAAIDINYIENDYYVGNNQDLRDTENPYYITDSVKNVLKKHGWYWGGDFSICTDTMHFQYTGLESLSYNNGSPFEVFNVETPYQKGSKIKAIQRRLKELGYKLNTNGKYTEKTASAVEQFREDTGLPKNGGTDDDFYINLYNMTPDLKD